MKQFFKNNYLGTIAGYIFAINKFFFKLKL